MSIYTYILIGGCSSAGRASDLHSEGHRFDPFHLHHLNKASL